MYLQDMAKLTITFSTIWSSVLVGKLSRVRMLDGATGFDADVVCERWREPDFIKEDKCGAQYRCCILIHYCAWHRSRVKGQCVASLGLQS